jgi:catechol 2,3-dioxygenase-like lactoylglutathione lyase family enzyme
MHLDHVQVAAPPGCEAQARAFYGAVLGLEEIAKPEPLRARGGVWFRIGDGRQLHVGVDPAFVPARKAHPAFAVDDLDALAARLGDVTWDDDSPGVGGLAADASSPRVRRFYASDPFGNRLEFLA